MRFPSITFIISLITVLFFGCQNKHHSPSDHTTIIATESKRELTGVYYLIRHAEKDRSNIANKDPELTPLGRKRAQVWLQYFDSIPLSGIYSTPYKRTLQTIIPTAANKSLNPIIYSPLDLFDNDFFTRSYRGHWLIVGHSNTIPELTNILIESDTLSDIPDTVNSRVYRVDFGTKRPRLDIYNVE